MAFFGLTALGPQDTFAHHAKGFVNIYVFEDADFDVAWRKGMESLGLGSESEVSLSQLEDIILPRLYKGPLPVNDKAVVMREFEGDKEVNFETYMLKMQYLRDKTASDPVHTGVNYLWGIN